MRVQCTSWADRMLEKVRLTQNNGRVPLSAQLGAGDAIRRAMLFHFSGIKHKYAFIAER